LAVGILVDDATVEVENIKTGIAPAETREGPGRTVIIRKEGIRVGKDQLTGTHPANSVRPRYSICIVFAHDVLTVWRGALTPYLRCRSPKR